MNPVSHRLREPLIAICLMAALASFPAAGAELADAAQAKKALDQVVERLNALESWINDAQKQRVRWQKDVQTKDKEVAGVARAVDQTVGELKGIETDLRSLTADQQGLENKRKQQAERIGKHLAASYRMTGQDFLKLLLNQVFIISLILWIVQ